MSRKTTVLDRRLRLVRRAEKVYHTPCHNGFDGGSARGYTEPTKDPSGRDIYPPKYHFHKYLIIRAWGKFSRLDREAERMRRLNLALMNSMRRWRIGGITAQSSN